MDGKKLFENLDAKQLSELEQTAFKLYMKTNEVLHNLHMCKIFMQLTDRIDTDDLIKSFREMNDTLEKIADINENIRIK